MPNQIPPELEKQILDMTAQYPTYSYLRISQQLRLIGVGVAPSAALKTLGVGDCQVREPG
jgi:hypothetical protein